MTLDRSNSPAHQPTNRRFTTGNVTVLLGAVTKPHSGTDPAPQRPVTHPPHCTLTRSCPTHRLPLATDHINPNNATLKSP